MSSLTAAGRFPNCSREISSWRGRRSNRLVKRPQEFVASQSLRAALLQESFTALDRRKEAYESLKSADDVLAWNLQRWEFFLKQLTGRILTRDPVGLSFTGDGRMAKYHDHIEAVDHQTYLFSSQFLDASGNRVRFMLGKHMRADES